MSRDMQSMRDIQAMRLRHIGLSDALRAATTRAREARTAQITAQGYVLRLMAALAGLPPGRGYDLLREELITARASARAAEALAESASADVAQHAAALRDDALGIIVEVTPK